jgi:F-type H+-transporting ATPase subunit b
MEEFLAGGVHWRILNFLIFLGVLFFALRKPVKEFWAGRAHEVRFEMEEAARLRREAAARHETLEKRLSRIETEVKDLVRTLEEEGELERKKMVEEAEKLALRIKQDSERIAGQEVLKAREALKAQAVELAMELAERQIRENFQTTDQKRLSEKYLKQLEGAA